MCAVYKGLCGCRSVTEAMDAGIARWGAASAVSFFCAAGRGRPVGGPWTGAGEGSVVKRIIYLDCYSGASGDMLLGALLDAGLSLDDLKADLALLDLQGYDLMVEGQTRHGIVGCKFDVVDLAHEHPARNLGVVRELIEASELADRAKARSVEVFTRLAEAEAGVHGTTVDAIHFHEVGAVDAVVDIVGFCCALERLGIEAVYASALPLGSGMVKTEHGLLPVPAPATLALLAAAGAPIAPSDARGELVTPTGAALLSTLATFEQPAMRVQRVGYGFGTKEFPWPNAVRVWVGQEIPARGLRPSSEGPHGHKHHAHHEHPHDHHHHPHAHPHAHEHAEGTPEKLRLLHRVQGASDIDPDER